MLIYRINALKNALFLTEYLINVINALKNTLFLTEYLINLIEEMMLNNLHHFA